jgi:hypothetical protein
VWPVTGAVTTWVAGARGCPAVGEAVCCPVAVPAVGGCVVLVPAAPIAVLFRTVPDALLPDCAVPPADGTSTVAA